MTTDFSDEHYGPVTVLRGERGGRYPDGNALLVAGERETLVIDPCLGLIERRADLPPIHRVLNSHCHEDHVAGNHLFPEVPWHLHSADIVGITSLDAMMEIYGFDGPIEAAFRQLIVRDFHYTSRPVGPGGAVAFDDGHVFDLGGVRVRAIHTPGHTRGHCCFDIGWREEGRERRLLYLGDIELTSFGPYYGDRWSDLADFETSLARVRTLEADWYATFHHIGVLEGRAAFLERLDRFEAKIPERESRLLDYLGEPRSLEEIVDHRFVYRPGDAVAFADSVERRSMSQHLERLVAAGRVEVSEDGRYARAPAEA